MYTYGVEGFWENGMYAGGLTTMVLYYVLGNVFYQQFHVKKEVETVG